VIKLATIAAVPVLYGLVASATIPGAAPSVTIDNFKFSPQPLIVDKGAEVTWTNRDDIPHSIVVPDLQQHSKPLDTDQAYSFRFDKSGSYNYICGLHPFMKGTIVVR
jgi:plastocyanin